MTDAGRADPAARPGGEAIAATGPHRLSTWFSVIGLLLLATVLAAAFMQVRQHALLTQTVQHQDDDLVLSLFQVQVEYLRLREQLHREVDPAASTSGQRGWYTPGESHCCCCCAGWRCRSFLRCA